MLRRVWWLVLVVALGLPPLTVGKAQAIVINLDHLRFLTETTQINGKEMAIVHIYSEYPSYKWVDASGEGISAVDDVARAAIVYLWEYERTKDQQWLGLARQCLDFVLYMQAPDGEFYNFVKDRTGTINETGNTSYKSLGWWAARGLWSLGEGVRVFQTVDKTYADELAAAYVRTEQAIAGRIKGYKEYTELHGYKIPAWIPNGEPDVAGIELLAMAAYYTARPNDQTKEVMTKIGDGLAEYHLGNHYAYPFGMHPVNSSAPGYWHDWGAHMGHGLVMGGMALGRQDWIDAAAKEADSFLLRQIVLERFRDVGVLPDRLGQIAYGTNMLVQTYMALYKATGEPRYARYGGLAASWLLGNNMAGVQMYYPDTGRVYDGINGPVEWRVNRNSGAESTIEGLMSLQVVVDVPEAAKYLQAKAISPSSWRIVQAEDGQRISGTPTYYSGTWTGESNISGGRYVGLSAGVTMQVTLEVPANNDYLLYVAHVRQTAKAPDDEGKAVRIDTPPTIDGKLDEWSAVPAIDANSPKQILRGAGFWQGPDKDSHAIQLAWDDQNLYVAATVHDPEYVQRYTLSNVWHDDALWFYVTATKDAQRLSSKFTFAQTPDGPQIWDWMNTKFLANATLAWVGSEGMHTFEASIPWTSMGIKDAAADKTIGLEVGRSVGGNSFMDLTGRDPDIASNLLPVTLIDPKASGGITTKPVVPSFLRLELKDGPSVVLEESISPDNDYWWLDLAWKSPVFLAKGEQVLTYSYAGAADGGGQSKVDAFYLQPAVIERTFQLPDGTTFTLRYNTLSGETTWNEQ